MIVWQRFCACLARNKDSNPVTAFNSVKNFRKISIKDSGAVEVKTGKNLVLPGFSKIECSVIVVLPSLSARAAPATPL